MTWTGIRPLSVEVMTLDATGPAWGADDVITVAETWDTGAYITWPEAVDEVGVSMYEVSLNGSLIKTVKEATQTALTKLNVWTEYQVMVRALDGAGNPSAHSLTGSFKTTDTSPPTWPEVAAVELLEVTATSASVAGRGP